MRYREDQRGTLPLNVKQLGCRKGVQFPVGGWSKGVGGVGKEDERVEPRLVAGTALEGWSTGIGGVGRED